MELWYRKLGFYNNPFSIKPGAFHDEVIGYNLGDFLEKIDTGNIQYVKADYGNGKTTMLKHIVHKFGGRKMVAFCSCNIAEKNIDTKELLLGRAFINKALRIIPKNMILLVDEAQDITKEEANDILDYFEKGNIKSVVFFGTEIKPKNFPKKLSQHLNGNIIALSNLSPEKAVEIVRKRIGDAPVLSDAIIKKLYSISGYNPRRLLENCEDLCKYVISRNENSATDRHVKTLFGQIKTKTVVRLKRKLEPEIKIEELDTRKDKVNLKFDYSNIRTYEEEMSFGRKV